MKNRLYVEALFIPHKVEGTTLLVTPWPKYQKTSWAICARSLENLTMAGGENVELVTSQAGLFEARHLLDGLRKCGKPRPGTRNPECKCPYPWWLVCVSGDKIVFVPRGKERELLGELRP